MKAIIFVLLAFIAYTSAHLCKAEGDPHYRSFGGRRFNYYATGEFVLFKRKGFVCHSKLAKSNVFWRGKSLNSGVACTVNGVHFEVDVGTSVRVFLNHRKFSGTKTIKGAQASFKGRNFFFKYKDMKIRGNYNKVSRGVLKNYLNLYVYSHKGSSTGLCQGQKLRAKKTLFRHGRVPKYHIGKKRVIPNKWIKWAAAICKRHFKVGSFSYNSCVTDMASSKEKRVAGQYERFKMVVKGNFKKVCHSHHCHYYKKVKHVKHIRYAKHHWKNHRIVDKVRRNKARVAANKHRQAIAKLQKTLRVQINNANKNYQRTYKNLRARITHANKHYSTTVHKMNKWRSATINGAKKAYLHTVNKMKKWRADAIRKANAHYNSVVSKKKKWYNSRIAYANNHRSKKVKSILHWRNRTLKTVNHQLKKVKSSKVAAIRRIQKRYSALIRKHSAAYKKQNHIARTAVKVVRKKHTTWHTRKHVTHKWVHYHHQK